MIELENPQIESVEEAGTYAKYEAGPLQAGYGVTLGNALRRVLLSSLEGAAVTSIQIRDVYQEFSTIPGVKEDVTQIVLNVKKLRLKSFASHPVQLRLIKSGAGPVIAADVAEPADADNHCGDGKQIGENDPLNLLKGSTEGLRQRRQGNIGNAGAERGEQHGE